MKNISICLLFLLNGLAPAEAQQAPFTYTSKHIEVPLSTVINMSGGAADYEPKLLLIHSAMPEPASEFKSRKNSLDAQRATKSKTQNHSLSRKKGSALPTISTSFLANVTQGTPNDNDFAISNGGKIISVVNSNLHLYDSTGSLIASRSLAFLASKLGTLNRTFDPRVIYDPKKDRFIVVFLQGSTSADTRIIVAFSQTNDPLLKWNLYVIPGNITNDSASWSDYPIIALTNDDLFITVNRVKDNTPWQTGFIESYIWQVEKQKGYDSAGVLPTKVYSDIKYNGKTIWSICPARGGSTTHGPNMYLLSVRPSDLSNDTVFLHEITNSLQSGSAALTLRVMKTDKAYGLMPNAIQPSGKKLQTNDARVLSACYEESWIHFTGNTIDTVTFSPAIYYGRVMNLNLPNPAIHGTIISSDTMDFGYPSVAYTGGGPDDRGVMLTHSFVSPTQFPGTAALYIDRAGTVSDMLVVKKGESSINLLSDSVERWGDYTGIQRKYNDPSYCWLNGSLGYQSTNRTWIARIHNNDPKLGVAQTQPGAARGKLSPNPASDYTFFDFELPARTTIEFEIRDAKGALAASLLREHAKAGTNRFSFRVNDLAEGVYFLNIKNGDVILESKKFTVVH